jgi:hypothetical protein
MAQPTDRELLEMAAKAMGRRITGWNTAQGEEVAVLDDGSFWQPLDKNRITDCNGDAFRLMVATKLHIGLESVTVSAWASDAYGNFQTEVLSHRGDEAATRRAIVRAAAAKVKGGAL